MPTPEPSFSDFLPAWMARQRWYAGKGHLPRLRRIGGLRFQDPAGDVGIETHLLVDDAAGEPTVYQVPLTYRSAPLTGADHALVTTTEHSELGTRYIYDAPHDPVFARVLLDLVLRQGAVASDGPGGTGTARGHRAVGAPDAATTVARSRVLAGEQSNTSVILETTTPDGQSGDPVIAKLFRVLHHGQNPDVVVQAALAAAGLAGSTLVPAPVGSIEGTWPDPGAPDGMATGHLGFAQEYLPDVQDAWRTALTAAAAGTDFSERARTLGAATARMHRTLGSAMPTARADERLRATMVDGMRARFALAITEVPALAEHEEAVDALYRAAQDADWPVLQRVHGDYHLGQVLDVPGHPGHGWVLLDFEGEPLRPLAERSAPDLALRDVAGMLRSFDYAAGSVEHPDPRDWAADARAAFLAGYTHVAGRGPRQDRALVDALELDKALYEVVYEARNRPTWLAIPTTAISRLLAGRRNPAVTMPPPTPDPTGPDPTNPDPPGPDPTNHKPANHKPANHEPGGRQPRATPLDPAEATRLVAGEHRDPHAVLGAHPHEDFVTVRALRPMARSVSVRLPDGGVVPAEHEVEGIWTAVLPVTDISDYRLDVAYDDGVVHTQDDPYRFLPSVGQIDLHLIGEGRHEQLWTVLGAHVRTYPGAMGTVSGTSFAVWAPHAESVRLVGDVNHWDGLTHPMRVLGDSGVWELFVPGLAEGSRYKYEILGSDSQRRTKADPLARATETPPATASVVTSTEYTWDDGAWMDTRRENGTLDQPMSIYEVHLGSWRQGASYRDLAEHLVDYVVDLGFTHVELLPVAEHPYGPSWGYQVTGYYAPTSRFGPPDDFRYLVDRLHRAGIGVILDWVPAHFPKDAFALARFDGQALYEHPDPRRGDQPDWGTHVFDYGRPQVRNFLVANALYWLEEFHVDGLRVDAVASMLYLDYSREGGDWVPNRYGGREHLEAVELLQETNATAYRRAPGVVMIAEESTAWPGVTRPTDLGGLGFELKWNLGWMHDSLDYAARAPVHRQFHHHQMTFSLMYAYSENYLLPISHDEVVHGKGSLLRKMPGDRWQQLANLRAYLAFMWAHPGKQLLFMGQEFAQEAEWADGRSLDWWLLDQPAHAGVHAMVRDLNRVHREHPALWALDHDPAGFSWIDADDAVGNTYSFLRYGPDDARGGRPVLAAVVNFSGAPHHQYRLALPHGGRWAEVLNTDAEHYGGSGVGNLGSVVAEEVECHGLPYSVQLTLPPLGMLWLAPAEGADRARRPAATAARAEEPEVQA